MERWNASYRHLLEQFDNREELTPAAPGWYLPDDERTSLFSCLIHVSGQCEPTLSRTCVTTLRRWKT
ncbi:hypothetical protein PF003_g26546 [Phytophthora fragariae]|nr:hypothetical protein PF003_g26546 [Phytophthora fragariae]